MSGKHSTKKRPERPGSSDPSATGVMEMPDPDNLRIDLGDLPKTGPISLPRRD